MTNLEQTNDLERFLKKKKTRRIIITSLVAFVFGCLGIVFSILYLASAEKIVIDGGFFGDYEYVTYNYDYVSGMIFPFLIAFYNLIFLLIICFTNYRVLKIEEDYLTVARGIFHCYVYLNGQEIAKLFGNRYYPPTYFLELKGGTKVHIRFGGSNNNASINYSKDLKNIDLY